MKKPSEGGRPLQKRIISTQTNEKREADRETLPNAKMPTLEAQGKVLVRKGGKIYKKNQRKEASRG